MTNKVEKDLAANEAVDNSKDQAVGQRLGFSAGQFSVPADFDEMGSDEINALFGLDQA